MPEDPQKILADPNFQGLPMPEQLKVMRTVDPNFAGLSPKDQETVLTKTRTVRTGSSADPENAANTPLSDDMKPGTLETQKHPGLGALAQTFNTPMLSHYAGEGLKGAAQAFNPIEIGKGFVQVFEHPEEVLKSLDPDTWVDIAKKWSYMSQEEKDAVARTVGNFGGNALLGKIVSSPEVPGMAKAALTKAAKAVPKVAKTVGPPVVGYALGKALSAVHPELGGIAGEVGGALGLSIGGRGLIKNVIKKWLDLKEDVPSASKASPPPIKPMQQGATAARRAAEEEGPKAPVPPVYYKPRPEPEGPKAPIPPVYYKPKPTPEGPKAPIPPVVYRPKPTPEGPKAPPPPIKPMHNAATAAARDAEEEGRPVTPPPPIRPMRNAATAARETEGEGESVPKNVKEYNDRKKARTGSEGETTKGSASESAKKGEAEVKKVSETIPGDPKYKLPAPYEANMKAKAQSGVAHLRKLGKTYKDYAAMSDEAKKQFWDEAHYTPDRLDHRGNRLVNRSKIPSGVDSNVETHMKEVMGRLPTPKAQPTKVESTATAPAVPYERVKTLIDHLEPQQGAPVSTKRLRDASGLSKESFDALMLKLKDEGKVYLAEHDHPNQLSEQDRNYLIKGKDGRYYVAVSTLP